MCVCVCVCTWVYVEKCYWVVPLRDLLTECVQTRKSVHLVETLKCTTVVNVSVSGWKQSLWTVYLVLSLTCTTVTLSPGSYGFHESLEWGTRWQSMIHSCPKEGFSLWLKESERQGWGPRRRERERKRGQYRGEGGEREREICWLPSCSFQMINDQRCILAERRRPFSEHVSTNLWPSYLIRSI